MNAPASRSLKTARRLGTLLAISGAAVGISAAAASAQPGSNPGGGATPIAKSGIVTDYPTLAVFSNAVGGVGGVPLIGWSAGNNPINPMDGAPAILISVPQTDVAAYPGGPLLSTSSSNLDTSYQVRVQCADGYSLQSPTQVFTATGTEPIGGGALRAGTKALEWPSAATRNALNPTFARHYAGGGCSAQLVTMPSARKTTTNAWVNTATTAAESFDNPYLNQTGFFEVAIRVSSAPGGSY